MHCICSPCREYLYRLGCFDSQRKNKYFIGGAVASFTSAAGGVGATAAVFKANLVSGALGSVLTATGAGLGIGSCMVMGAICIYCGTRNCQDSSSPVLPCRTVQGANPNPLDHISPPRQEQMLNVLPPSGGNQIPSSGGNQMLPPPFLQQQTSSEFRPNPVISPTSTLNRPPSPFGNFSLNSKNPPGHSPSPQRARSQSLPVIRTKENFQF